MRAWAAKPDTDRPGGSAAPFPSQEELLLPCQPHKYWLPLQGILAQAGLGKTFSSPPPPNHALLEWIGGRTDGLGHVPHFGQGKAGPATILSPPPQIWTTCNYSPCAHVSLIVMTIKKLHSDYYILVLKTYLLPGWDESRINWIKALPAALSC